MKAFTFASQKNQIKKREVRKTDHMNGLLDGTHLKLFDISIDNITQQCLKEFEAQRFLSDMKNVLKQLFLMPAITKLIW